MTINFKIRITKKKKQKNTPYNQMTSVIRKTSSNLIITTQNIKPRRNHCHGDQLCYLI